MARQTRLARSRTAATQVLCLETVERIAHGYAVGPVLSIDLDRRMLAGVRRAHERIAAHNDRPHVCPGDVLPTYAVFSVRPYRTA